jgi:hypothetical protein
MKCDFPTAGGTSSVSCFPSRPFPCSSRRQARPHNRRATPAAASQLRVSVIDQDHGQTKDDGAN